MQIGDLLKHYETGQYYIIVDHLIDIEYDIDVYYIYNGNEILPCFCEELDLFEFLSLES